MPSPEFNRAQWPAPPRVHTLITTRNGGVSRAPYDGGQPGAGGWNLGARVGDAPQCVAENRQLLRAVVGYPIEYMHQVHGAAVADLDVAAAVPERDADAAVASAPGRVCVILMADCLPVLLCNRAGTAVAAAHCGWRGLAGGVLERTVAALCAKHGDAPDALMAWLGPAIGPPHFEVGPDVRAAFVAAQPSDAAAFTPSAGPGGGEKWRADLFALARARLQRAGVMSVHGGGDCTFAQPQRYYSHRRATHAGTTTGRMAAAVWLA